MSAWLHEPRKPVRGALDRPIAFLSTCTAVLMGCAILGALWLIATNVSLAGFDASTFIDPR